MKSLQQQIDAMAERWPEFKVTERSELGVTWNGILAPDKRSHKVRIGHRIPHALANVNLHDSQPRVQIISPLLERHPDYHEGPIPHVYINDKNPELPYLCLFSPTSREWSLDDLIADTIVFWTAEWLYFYEGWLATKRWHGGGRHPNRQPSEPKTLETI